MRKIISNKAGKQFALFISTVGILAFMPSFLASTPFNNKVWGSLLPVVLIIQQLFFSYKHLFINDQKLIVRYPLRLLKREVIKPISDIRQIDFRLNQSGKAYPMVVIRFKSTIQPFEFRLSNTEEFEDFISIIAKKGSFKLKSKSKSYGYIKGLVATLKASDRITFGDEPQTVNR